MLKKKAQMRGKDKLQRKVFLVIDFVVLNLVFRWQEPG